MKADRSEMFGPFGAFYRHYDTRSPSFRKYYNRYLSSGQPDDLLLQKRGPR